MNANKKRNAAAILKLIFVVAIVGITASTLFSCSPQSESGPTQPNNGELSETPTPTGMCYPPTGGAAFITRPLDFLPYDLVSQTDCIVQGLVQFVPESYYEDDYDVHALKVEDQIFPRTGRADRFIYVFTPKLYSFLSPMLFDGRNYLLILSEFTVDEDLRQRLGIGNAETYQVTGCWRGAIVLDASIRTPAVSLLVTRYDIDVSNRDQLVGVFTNLSGWRQLTETGQRKVKLLEFLNSGSPIYKEFALAAATDINIIVENKTDTGQWIIKE